MPASTPGSRTPLHGAANIRARCGPPMHGPRSASRIFQRHAFPSAACSSLQLFVHPGAVEGMVRGSEGATALPYQQQTARPPLSSQLCHLVSSLHRLLLHQHPARRGKGCAYISFSLLALACRTARAPRPNTRSALRSAATNFFQPLLDEAQSTLCLLEPIGWASIVAMSPLGPRPWEASPSTSFDKLAPAYAHKGQPSSKPGNWTVDVVPSSGRLSTANDHAAIIRELRSITPPPPQPPVLLHLRVSSGRFPIPVTLLDNVLEMNARSSIMPKRE